MRPSNDLDHVWLARKAVDFRKGINGRSILLEEQLARDHNSAPVFESGTKPRSSMISYSR